MTVKLPWIQPAAIWEKQSTRGFLGDYRYLVHANDQGYQIIFLDCGRNLDSYRNFMLTGIGVCFGGMLAVLFLLILLSGADHQAGGGKL